MLALLVAAQITLTQVSFPSRDPGVMLTATLYAPPAAMAPSPAVVVLHTCAGIDADMDDWARWLAENGYIALVPDSFTPRRVRRVCGTHDAAPKLRALDAYGALAYLRTISSVDAKRVGEMGFSHGGGAVLWTENREVAARAGFASGGFAAAVAFYPSECDAQPARALLTPLLILIGGLDDWTDAHTCASFIGEAAAGAHGQIMVYQDAFHKFDDPRADRIVRIRGEAHTLRYDAAAAADAHARVLAFFKHYL